MSPSEEADRKLRRLIRDLDADLVAMESRAAEIEDLGRRLRPAAADAAVLAVALHHYYTAFEAALERCIRFFDGDLPQGADWHRALLQEASRPLPGVRPGFISPDTVPDWDELLRFRHFFRHAYAVSLDWNRLVSLVEICTRLQVVACSDFSVLRKLLTVMLDEIGKNREP